MNTTMMDTNTTMMDTNTTMMDTNTIMMDTNTTMMDTNTIVLDTLQAVQRYIDMISIPICLVCGTVGHIISFIVYIRKWSSFTVPLAFLSCFDLLLLWTDSVFSGSWAYFRHVLETRPYGCGISYYLLNALFWASTIIIALFSILRTFSVVRPLQFAPIFTTKRVLRTACILTVIVFGLQCHLIYGFINIPHYSTTILYRYMVCGFRSDAYNTFYFNYWALAETIVLIVSLGAIVIGNSVVITSLVRRKQIGNTAIDASGISGRLIAVSIVQILAWAPWIVLSLFVTGTEYDREVGSYEERLPLVLLELGFVILRAQCGFGFLAYTFVGSEFRTEFLRIICCKNGLPPTSQVSDGQGH